MNSGGCTENPGKISSQLFIVDKPIYKEALQQSLEKITLMMSSERF